MRNIEKYEQHYLEHPFERVLEKYRRNVVKKQYLFMEKSGM